MTQDRITYGDREVLYDVAFSDRATLEISVLPDCSVAVKSPRDTEIDRIKKQVKSRARWILKQQDYFQKFQSKTSPHQYISGETHLYLGRQYRLKILESNLPSVKLKGGYIQIQIYDPNNRDLIRQLLKDWYKSRAEVKFSERLTICCDRFQKYGFSCPVLQIRHLSKRWGSLTLKGKIILNQDLIRADSGCIDYVITHELCHLKHPNHSKKFYSFLSQMMADWKSRKQRLERLLI